MIEDWSEAYSNAPIIPNASAFPDRWLDAACTFREAIGPRAELELPYGEDPRHRFDLFHPVQEPHGLMVFVHGGYWMTFGKQWWSHLARGALDSGWAVAIPQYTLAPSARISEITREIAAAVTAAASRVAGPLRLAGHSAGGHLVCRMICKDAPLSVSVQRRVDHVLTISGVHDLRPLLRTQLNGTLQLTETEARSESPALLEPISANRLTAWVGALERPEFIRQTDLISNIWTGFGMTTAAVHEKGRNHFDVIDGLTDCKSSMCEAILH